ncbi:helix-turn-helix domain-containing protein [Methylobacterium sp. DB0501]|uniref:helix-turn-helix domain-containing protein n=1 Tax=Methylobacterium sp. DB0501 TaxID=2709665 RepID=UPI0013EA4AA2|nr:helix-turn-helix domain-containing protein [Methylobacterium sp. DB0501]NGM33859.1 helix-turn-helix domain-containing protein [Methylobacterium sp. DB0501]
MSVVATKWAKRQRVRTTCRVVLNALADYADKEGRCWPSQATLAAETGLAVRTIRLVLAELSAAGAIARTHRGNGVGGRASDLIVLNLAADFDLVTVAVDPMDRPEPARPSGHDLPADDAAKSGNGYRHIKDGLAASEGKVSGTTCRGKNLPRTTMNLLPSREKRFQDVEQVGATRRPGTPFDPFGDDAFGPSSPLGLDSPAWDDLDVAAGGDR